MDPDSPERKNQDSWGFLGQHRSHTCPWELGQESGEFHVPPGRPATISGEDLLICLPSTSSQMVRFLAASSSVKSNLPLPGPGPTPAKNVWGQRSLSSSLQLGAPAHYSAQVSPNPAFLFPRPSSFQGPSRCSWGSSWPHAGGTQGTKPWLCRQLTVSQIPPRTQSRRRGSTCCLENAKLPSHVVCSQGLTSSPKLLELSLG